MHHIISESDTTVGIRSMGAMLTRSAQKKTGFVETVYSACGELRIGDPQMGYGCKPLEGQNNSHTAHMPGFILPQVSGNLLPGTDSVVCVRSYMDYTCGVYMCVYTTSGVN